MSTFSKGVPGCLQQSVGANAAWIVALSVLGGCATSPASTDSPARIVNGAAVGAVVPGVSVAEGAIAGAAIGGLTGALWADQNNDGYVDGYTYNGQYYAGTPAGYDPTLGRIATGAVGGAALGAVAGAAIPGLSVIEGAVIGAATGRIAGGVWADRNNDGQVDGYIYNGQYYQGTPPAATTTPAPIPVISGERDVDFEEPYRAPARVSPRASNPHRRPTQVSDYAEARAEQSNGGSVSEVRVWHSTNGALTSEALRALVRECNVNWGGLTGECQAAARTGAGNFRVVPEGARNEFAFLIQASCPPDRVSTVCDEAMETNRIFRSLPRGRLDPQPLKMHEGKRTRFTAVITDRGGLRGIPGAPTDSGLESDPNNPAVKTRVRVIPISARMCFGLTPEDSTKVEIEPIREPDAVLERGRICMDIAEGGGGVKFDPSWWVTPKSGDDLRVYLHTVHLVGNERRKFKNEPWPMTIDVVPKASLWNRVDGWLRRATATVNLAAGLAEALGLLFVTIAGWVIWKWILPLFGNRSRRAAANR